MAVTPLTYALVDLADTKEHLGVPVVNTTYDDIIQRFINATTDRLEKITGRRLKQRTGIAEYQDGLGNNRILMHEWPVVKPTEVWVDNSSAFTDANNQLAVSDYELEESPRGEGVGIVLVGGCSRLFSKGTRNIKIVYDGGYAVVPADLQDAAFWGVEYLWNMRTDDSIGVITKGKNQENTTFREAMPLIIQETIDAYTRFEFALGNRAVRTL